MAQNEIDVDVEMSLKEINEEVNKELSAPSLASSDPLCKSKTKKLKQVIALNQIHSPRLWKNSRRSRNGYGRGLPKKKGAGGKGVWGLPGSELYEADEDINDPNYDNENMNNGSYLVAVDPVKADNEFKKIIEPVIQEYFEHCRTIEVSDAVFLSIPPSRRNIVVEKSIEIALDHKASHRELTSILISELSNDCISASNITKAFENILADIDDLALDIPDAPILIGNFIARAIADDCITPSFIEQTREKSEGEKFLISLDHAKVLINMDHGMSRLHNVWGFGGPQRPVKYLTKRMIADLKEYISCRDLKEASCCLKQLEVPHFHHEYVYEAIIMALEANRESVEEAICELLSSFAREVLITVDQMEKGFLRIFNDLADIQMDVPLAHIIIERFLNRCIKAGFLTEATIEALPSRGRKRFVSEGDYSTKKDKMDINQDNDNSSKSKEG